MVPLQRLGFALLVIAACALAPFRASADIAQVIPVMGDLTRWTAVSLGATEDRDRFGDNAGIQGDVAVGGNGNIALEGNSTLNGDLYCRSNGRLDLSGNATITGMQFHDQNSVIDNAIQQANATSKLAANLQATNPLSTVDLNDQDLTLSGSPGETVVLNLKNFRLNGTSTLTLQGTAATTFIINVRNQFSLVRNSRVVLSGGLTWSDVLFNVRGSDGGNVRVADSAQLEGMLLATRRTVRILNGGKVSGSLIGDRVVLLGNSQVTTPPTVSP